MGAVPKFRVLRESGIQERCKRAFRLRVYRISLSFAFRACLVVLWF